MSSRTQLKYRLEHSLPRHPVAGSVFIKVTPRDASERKCSLYLATHFELQAFYTVTSYEHLIALEEALRTVPGVYAVTRVIPEGDRVTFTNPEWPAPLGTARRGRDLLRAQVIALIADPAPTS
jgi:hypothetical protein